MLLEYNSLCLYISSDLKKYFCKYIVYSRCVLSEVLKVVDLSNLLLYLWKERLGRLIFD